MKYAFPQMIQIVKRQHSHHSGEKILMVKIREFWTQYHAKHVNSIFKTIALSDKVSVWSGMYDKNVITVIDMVELKLTIFIGYLKVRLQ